MTVHDLEDDLRAVLARQVSSAPPLAGLGDAVVRRGRRRRRARAAAAVGAVITAVGVAALLLPGLALPTSPVAAAPSGPPQVPVYAAQSAGTEMVDWETGAARSRLTDGQSTPVAVVPSGVLVTLARGELSGLGLLGPDAEDPRLLLEGLRYPTAAVADDGARAAVVRQAEGLELVEVSLPAGEVLRTVRLAPPLVGPGEPVVPVAYSGQAVLLTLGEGERQRVALWEAGPDDVVGTLDGYARALGGTAGDDARGRAALATQDGGCGTEVVGLQTGGDSWRLCRETFAGFSPDGRYVLSVNAVGDGLLVRDADDGDLVREVRVPQHARGHGWETPTTFLYATVDEAQASTLVVRCAAAGGACRTAAAFPFVDRVPVPVPPA